MPLNTFLHRMSCSKLPNGSLGLRGLIYSRLGCVTSSQTPAHLGWLPYQGEAAIATLSATDPLGPSDGREGTLRDAEVPIISSTKYDKTNS